jgi:hypothetical protein
MSTDADLEGVINRTALIENLLNQVIEAYLQPRKEATWFLWDVVFNTAVLPLSSKVKIASAISQKLSTKLNGDALQKIMQLRNAFAHHATNAHPVFYVGKTPEHDESHYLLHVMSSSGKITKKRRVDALAEFNDAYSKAKASLLDLLSSIRKPSEHSK